MSNFCVGCIFIDAKSIYNNVKETGKIFTVDNGISVLSMLLTASGFWLFPQFAIAFGVASWLLDAYVLAKRTKRPKMKWFPKNILF